MKKKLAMGFCDGSPLAMCFYDSSLAKRAYDGLDSALISDLGPELQILGPYISFSCCYRPQQFICNLRLQNNFNLPKVPDKYLMLAHKAKKYWKSLFQLTFNGLSIWIVLFIQVALYRMLSKKLFKTLYQLRSLFLQEDKYLPTLLSKIYKKSLNKQYYWIWAYIALYK